MDQASPRILIIDDDSDNVAIIKYILRKENLATIESVVDPRRALEAFLAFQPDIVLLDFRMAPIDGFAVLEQIKPHIPAGEYLPVLMLTGDESPEVKKRALESGAVDFVTKSFDNTELLLRVKNLLHTRILYQQVQRQNELLEERVRERTHELEQAQSEMLERLALAAEFRDDATGEHTRRVSDLSARIAEALKMPDDFVQTIRAAALLHDLGKIGIPDSILRNSQRLTAEEYEFIKAHTLMGGKILSGCTGPLLVMAREIALSHHEAWNGQGYPAGLSGEEIPLSGRIVAVADVYDALTASRPYKSAYAVSEAISEICEESGRRFDPSVVNAFLQVAETFRTAAPPRSRVALH